MSNNWNGLGYPVVGEMVFVSAICELDNNFRFAHKEVKVEATFYNESSYCIAVSHQTLGIGAIVFHEKWIKPIKSDRDKAIDEMEAEWNAWSGTNTRSSLGRLYDAGFRKQSGE